ncbi:MAG: efflux transporter outer membrane subunit [Formivibrio sp.]|nr:efflux transporter outer membrane subunit [Formivibrio sp.]
MNRSRATAAALVIILSAFLSACAVGPEYRRPTLSIAPQWYATLPHGGDPGNLAQWWAQFDDPLPAELIAEAQRNNPGLNQALARIAQSRAGVIAARSTLFPTLSANTLAQRSNSIALTTPQTLGQATLDASWEIDLFGANRRGREAAQARYEGAQAQWHDARVSLAAEVAQEYVGLRACEALVKNLAEDLASRRESERLTHLKVDAGFDAPADGALASASAADAAGRVNAQRAECDISIKALVALTGLPEPDLRNRLAARTGILPTPASFTIVQLPAHTLMQRPDMAAAERELAAASAEIGGAEAARYPSLTLTGSVGFQTLRTGGITLDDKLWSFGPALSLPIFDAGRRAANVDAAQARYNEALANYTGRARQAVREVEQALVRLNSASARESDAQRAAEGYDKVFKAAEDRWRVGTGSLLELEDTRRTAVASCTQLLTVQRERIAAWISLYRAAGGGWSPTDPVDPAKS